MSNQIFQVDPEASTGIHEGGMVILHLGQGRLYRCNGTGARIWRGIEQHLPAGTIAEQVSGEFQIALGIALEHTVRFLGELERHTLIHRSVQ